MERLVAASAIPRVWTSDGPASANTRVDSMELGATGRLFEGALEDPRGRRS